MAKGPAGRAVRVIDLIGESVLTRPTVALARYDIVEVFAPTFCRIDQVPAVVVLAVSFVLIHLPANLDWMVTKTLLLAGVIVP